MTTDAILTSFDHAALVGIRILIAVFTALAILLALFFSIAITALVLLFAVMRTTLVFVLSRQTTRATFAAIGGRV